MIHKIGGIALFKSWDPDDSKREPFFIISKDELNGEEFEVDIKHIPDIVRALCKIIEDSKSAD